MKGRKKVFLTLILTVIATLTLGMGVFTASANNVDLSTYEPLVFKHAYMGGEDRTIAGQSNAKTVPEVLSRGLSLTFSTNMYYVGGLGSSAGSGYYTVHNQASAISGKKNIDLVEYSPKGSSIVGISSIWFDTQSNLVFVPNGFDNGSYLSALKDPNTGLPYYNYNDGDEITIKAGFKVAGTKGNTQINRVLQEDVKARFNETTYTWEIISDTKGTTPLAMAKDVTVTESGISKTWGALVNLFGTSSSVSRIQPDTAVSSNIADYNVKEAVRTDIMYRDNPDNIYGYADKMYYLNRPYVKYFDANGIELDIFEIYYTTSGVVIRANDGTSDLASARTGDSILLKKGFREGYYYGQISEYYSGLGVIPGDTQNNVFQTTRVLGEDVALRYNGSTWELIQTVPNDIKVSSKLKTSGQELFWGQRVPMTFNVPVTEKVEYTSSNPELVTVDEDGYMMALPYETTPAQPWLYVTAKFASGKEVSLMVGNFGRSNITNYVYWLDSSSYGKVILYKDANGNIDQSEEAKREIAGQLTLIGTMSNYPDSTEIRLSEKDITSIRANSVTFTYNNFTPTLDAQLFDKPADKTLVKENILTWNSYISIQLAQENANTNHKEPFVDVTRLEKMGQMDKMILRSADGTIKYNANRVKYIYGYQIVPMFVGKGNNSLEVGDVLEIKKGLKIYRVENDAPIAIAEIQNDLTLVYTGSKWEETTVDAEDIDIELTSSEVTLPIGSYHKVEYNVKPSGAYATAKITSEDPSKVAVSEDGKYIKVLGDLGSGVIVKVSLGSKTYDLLVKSTSSQTVTGYKIFTEKLAYSVGYNEDLTFTYYENGLTERQIQAVPVYADGKIGTPFDLTTKNTVVEGYDKTFAGDQVVTLKITHNGVTKNITDFGVTVYENRDQVVSLILQDPYLKPSNDPNYSPMLLIDFNAFSGNVNVPYAIAEKLYNISDYVDYKRGTTSYKDKGIDVLINAQHLVVRPKLELKNNSGNYTSFEVKDQVILKEGLPLVTWAGDTIGYATTGNGNWVKVGEVVCDVIIECSDNSNDKAKWETMVEYSDLILEKDTLNLPLSDIPQATGISIFPKYATTGELIYESLNPDIAEINANEQIVTKSVGTAKIKITLKRMDKLANSGDTSLQPIVKILTVVVEEAPTGIQLPDDIIKIKKGTVLTGEILKNRGVQAKLVWADGSVRGEADITSAEIDGYYKNLEGEQEIYVYVEYFGIFFYDTLMIEVVPEDTDIDETPLPDVPDTPDNPDDGGDTTPDDGGDTTPDDGGDTTPDDGGDTTPDDGFEEPGDDIDPEELEEGCIGSLKGNGTLIIAVLLTFVGAMMIIKRKSRN